MWVTWLPGSLIVSEENGWGARWTIGLSGHGCPEVAKPTGDPPCKRAVEEDMGDRLGDVVASGVGAVARFGVFAYGIGAAGRTWEKGPM